MKKAIQFAAASAGALALTGCNEDDRVVYTSEIDFTQNPSISVTTIAKGSFVEYLEDGMHIIEVPGEKMGSEEEKLRIFILKDQRSVGHRSIGYLGLDVLDSNNGPE